MNNRSFCILGKQICTLNEYNKHIDKFDFKNKKYTLLYEAKQKDGYVALDMKYINELINIKTDDDLFFVKDWVKEAKIIDTYSIHFGEKMEQVSIPNITINLSVFYGASSKSEGIVTAQKFVDEYMDIMPF